MNYSHINILYNPVFFYNKKSEVHFRDNLYQNDLQISQLPFLASIVITIL